MSISTGELRGAASGPLMQEIATRSSDPTFFGALQFLPNPDPVLRKLGKSQEVFDAITLDAHVIGELRSIRAGTLGFEFRLQAGGESSADIRALELCQAVMQSRPHTGYRWPDVVWNMAQAVFRGHAIHEVIWRREGGAIVPSLIDRPQRRFVFGTDNELRLRTRAAPIAGEQTDPYKWLVTRHMPSFDNPYGVALFSACFWPYTFKHSGYKYFVKFTEKYGMPWAIGRYPMGTQKGDQDALADMLAAMVEDGVAAIPDGNAVELLEAKSTGDPVQSTLIKMCNSEMSKALTSQTLATEIQGQGSRAAASTHRQREEDVNASDREIICDTFNQLFAWITEINIAGAQPPTFEFYEEAEARKDWVEVLDSARAYLDVPVEFAHERLQIPQPQDGEAVLPRAKAPTKVPPQPFS
ncbi:MAG: DUF935 domain-containing protein, partial [Gammaproteobacteria bacterium]|nr:DUF935 domain-containing protein [Gammaproteobacteria bacterium]